MEMKVLNCQKQLCHCCMEEHDVRTVSVRQTNRFKGINIEYEATYFYCDRADMFISDEDMISSNDISMKNAYRIKMGLLTTDEIAKIRRHYTISQSDLAKVLGWGEKTITRYEGHQVQDQAHDAILRKISEDPKWLIEILEKNRDEIGQSAYTKAIDSATAFCEVESDEYLKSAILSRYAKYRNKEMYNGGVNLNLDKVIDVINYYANSSEVTDLYKVKLMKLLWYADSLSYKKLEHTITGLVYQAMPLGALPIAYESIIDLKDINTEVSESDIGTVYRFLPSDNKEYKSLCKEEIGILDDVISRLGKMPKKKIVEVMHNEEAYKKTGEKDIILFEYARELSI